MTSLCYRTYKGPRQRWVDAAVGALKRASTAIAVGYHISAERLLKRACAGKKNDSLTPPSTASIIYRPLFGPAATSVDAPAMSTYRRTMPIMLAFAACRSIHHELMGSAVHRILLLIRGDAMSSRADFHRALTSAPAFSPPACTPTFSFVDASEIARADDCRRPRMLPWLPGFRCRGRRRECLLFGALAVPPCHAG